MNTNESIEALMIAAENMLANLPLAPTAPLADAQALVNRLMPDGYPPDEWPDAVAHLAEAMECVEWSFWPPDEYGSREASANIDDLMKVAECLEKLKKELANAGQD